MQTEYLIIGLLGLICITHNTLSSKRIYQLSSINNKKYLVRESTKIKQTKSANILANLSKKKDKLILHIEKSDINKSDPGIKRLLNYKNVDIEELSFKYNNEAAYSINKGERIGICIRNKQGKIEDENTMMFVLLHELAHIMSKKYAHDDEFWNNFAKLLKIAIKCGVYKYVNYESNPTTFCGHDITHSPS